MFRYICFLTVYLIAPMAVADITPWDIASVDVREVEDVTPFATTGPNLDDCGKAHTADLSTIGWGDIITIGEKIWTIVEANKSVVNLTPAPAAYALPAGLGCWLDLSGWAPQTRSYEVSYKNLMGIEVVRFKFRLQFAHGGGSGDKGKYLANVTVVPAELNVIWGYKFDAGVDVEQAVNMGSDKDPVAGLGLNLKWTVKTVLKESQNSVHFFVQGDGQVQKD